MKKVKLRYKVQNASTIADIVGSNGFVNLLSYTVSGGIFDEFIEQYLAIPEDKEDTAIAKLNEWIVKTK